MTITTFMVHSGYLFGGGKFKDARGVFEDNVDMPAHSIHRGFPRDSRIVGARMVDDMLELTVECPGNFDPDLIRCCRIPIDERKVGHDAVAYYEAWLPPGEPVPA